MMIEFMVSDPLQVRGHRALQYQLIGNDRVAIIIRGKKSATPFACCNKSTRTRVICTNAGGLSAN